MRKNLYVALSVCIGGLWPMPSATAAIIEFWNDHAAWASAVETYNFVDFTGFRPDTVITNQYSSQGIVFTSLVFVVTTPSFSDNWGISSWDGVRIEFDTPQHAVGVDHLGSVTFALYSQGILIETSNTFAYAGTGTRFSGIVSDIAFDEVYMFRPPPGNNAVTADNLYWGIPVPAPGALPLLALGFLCGARRRRR